MGIGKAIAESCAARGMNLILVSLPGESLEELSYQIATAYHINTCFFELDLASDEAPRKLLDWCKEQNLTVHTLINNAGIGYEGHFENYTTSFYSQLLKLNVIALTLITREFLPELKKQKEARILNVSSMGGFYPMPYKSVYAASKSYVAQFSEALHQELRDTNVTVSLLCPAGVDSYDDSSVRIDKIGWIAKFGRLTPNQVAEIAVDGMLKKKRRIIPGKINVLFHYLSRPLPTWLKARLIHFVLCKFHKSTGMNSSIKDKAYAEKS